MPTQSEHWRYERIPRFSKPYADFVARLRVPSGFLLVAAFAWFSQPSLRSLLWGLPVSLLGLRLGGRLPRQESGAGYRRSIRLHP
jgi:hypothetical protein